jgi:hypothetical protein
MIGRTEESVTGRGKMALERSRYVNEIEDVRIFDRISTGFLSHSLRKSNPAQPRTTIVLSPYHRYTLIKTLGNETVDEHHVI